MSLISNTEALELLQDNNCPGVTSRFLDLLSRACAARELHSGRKIEMCSIVNARCGNCTENCAFCAQSARSKAPIHTWDILSADEIVKGAENASKAGARRYGIVTSGRSVGKGKELDVLCDAIQRIRKNLDILPCASLGILSEEVLLILKEAGLERYHHNLETAESFFPSVCSTRKYEDQTRTVKLAKKAGLSVCSGGIFGLGESNEQRIELLDCIRSLGVDSVPINFLNAIPGTPLEHAEALTPSQCLRIIAVAKLMMPSVSIRICGGREKNLRDFQSWIFAAGADSFMTGGYLVTPGRDRSSDLQMIRDAAMTLLQ